MVTSNAQRVEKLEIAEEVSFIDTVKHKGYSEETT
jgi:hypothetical protein